MNRIFRTVWNRVRRQLVAVNETVTGASQASGSTVKGSVVNAQPVNTVGVTLKKSALALAVGSALALSLPAATASWIDDNGGVDGKLDWVVGSDGSSAWNPITNSVVRIEDGETLTLSASGSTYMPGDTTTPDMINKSIFFNQGTVNIDWTGSAAQGYVEIDSAWIDNSGSFNVSLKNPTPVPESWYSSNVVNLNGIEVQKSGVFDYAGNGWTDDDEFINREGATVKVEIEHGTTSLDSTQASSWRSLITGLALNGSTISGRNEGTIEIDLATADSVTRGMWIRNGSQFVNSETGFIDITIDKYESDPALSSRTDVANSAIYLDSTSTFVNDGNIQALVEGGYVYGFNSWVNTTERDSSVFTNNGTFGFEVTAEKQGTDIVAHGIRIGVNDSFINNGEVTGTITAVGGGVKGIELRDGTSIFSNEAGAVLNLTLNSTALDQTGTRGYAQGIMINGAERFDNKGSATFTVGVDGSDATASTQFATAVGVTMGATTDTESHHSVFTNAENADLTINASGPTVRGIHARYYAEVQNEGNITIKLSREPENLTYGSDTGIWVGDESSFVNSGTITISSDLKMGDGYMAGGSAANTIGAASGLSVSSGASQDKKYLVNEVGGLIDIDMTVANTVEGQTTGERLHGISVASVNVDNAGTMQIDATGNYGQVDQDFDVFSTMALSYGEANKRSTELGFVPVFNNSGLIEGSATIIAEGINVSANKGWAVGFNLHGAVQFNNTGTIDLSAHSTSRSKAGSVEGSTFINDKDVTFEATTDAEGSFAYALNVGKPNSQVTQSRSLVDNNGTLNLIAESQNGYAYGVYFTDGDFTNDGTITLDIDGGASRGIYLHTGDLEQAGTALNPVFVNNNLIKGTVTSDDFEQDYAAGIFMSLGEFTNNGTIDLDVIGGRIQGLGTRGGSGTKFVNAKGSTLTLDIISNNEISHASSVYISPIDGIIASGLSTFENAGTVTVNLESHLGFVKGLVSTSGGVLKNSGTIIINGTAYGDYAYPEDVDPGDEWQMAYGIDLDTEDGAAGFTNEGTINIDVDSMRGYSYAAYVNGEGVFFNNASTGTLNLTVDGHQHHGYGIYLDQGATSVNDGLIDMELRPGTTDNSSVWGIAVRYNSSLTNNGSIVIDGWGSHSSAAPNGIWVGQADSEFINNGSYVFNAHRNSTNVDNASDYDGIRIDHGKFTNTASGTITIDLDAPHNQSNAYAFGINMMTYDGTFQNAGQVTITLDQLADNAGIAYGYRSGQDLNTHAVGLINEAGGVITITADGESKENVWGIYSTNNITNTGTISTNAAIYANAISGAVGTWILSGADTESTVLDSFKTGSLTNAGKLTIDADGSLQGTQALWASRIENTGEINTGATYISAADGVVNNYGTINVTTAKERIALGLGASQDYDSVVWTNEVGSELNVDLTTTTALLQELGSMHTAGIDMYTPQSDLNAPAAHLINKGTVDVDVRGETGLMYGIVYDGGTGAVLDNQGTMTIDVTKSAVDVYEAHGLSLRRAGQYSNSGTLDINAHSAGGNRNVYGLLLQGADDGSFRVDFTNSGNLILTASTDLVPASTTQENGEAVALRIDDGTFTNEVGGSVQADVKSIKTAGIQLVDAGVFDNYGKVSVDLIPVDLTGVQTLGTNSLKGLSIRGTSTFTNYEGGEIEVTLTNDGSVPAQVASLLGVGGEGSANFVNQGTVTLKSEDLATTGSTGGDQVIGVLIGENGTLTNEKSLTIEQKAQYATGMRLSRANSSFVNTGTTEMTLEGIGDTDVGNITALSVQDSTAKLNNQGTFKITLAGTGKNATGILVNNAASTFGNNGDITINVTGDFVNAKAMDVAGTIANNGTITTNGAIEVGKISGAQGKLGDLILTGTDTVSVIHDNASVSKLVNAGTLTINQEATLNSFVLHVEELENTGILNTAGYVEIADKTDGKISTVLNSGTINIVDEVGLHRFGILSGNEAKINNESDGLIKISLKSTYDQIHALSTTDTLTGIDMAHYSVDYVGGQLLNSGDITVAVESDRGKLYGLIFDGESGHVLDNQGDITVTLTKTQADDLTAQGVAIRSAGDYRNSGTITVNGTNVGGWGSLDAIRIDNNFSDGKRVGFTNAGTINSSLTGQQAVNDGDESYSGVHLLHLNYTDFVNETSGSITGTLDAVAAYGASMYASTFSNKVNCR